MSNKLFIIFLIIAYIAERLFAYGTLAPTIFIPAVIFIYLIKNEDMASNIVPIVLAGLAYDLVSGAPFGLSLIALAVTYLLVIMTKQYLNVSPRSLGGLVVAVIATSIFFSCLMGLLMHSSIGLRSLLSIAIEAGLACVVITFASLFNIFSQKTYSRHGYRS